MMSSLVAFSQFSLLLQKHAVTFWRQSAKQALGVADCTVQFSYVLVVHEIGKGPTSLRWKSRWIVSNYSAKWRWIYRAFRRLITLAYTKQWISEVKKLQSLCVFMPYFEICKQTRKLTIVQCVSVTISASLVKLRRIIMFKYKTLPWKTPKPNFVAFFVLIWMAFSSISEVWASFKFSGNQDAMLSISCADMRARNILGYS